MMGMDESEQGDTEGRISNPPHLSSPSFRFSNHGLKILLFFIVSTCKRFFWEACAVKFRQLL